MLRAWILFSFMFLGSLAFAQNDFENLKVLPKDISKDQLSAIMRAWSDALGVRCNFCHVGEPGAPLSTYDFKSDEKNHKEITRTMVKLVKAINEDHLGEMAKGRQIVNCRTCHHGLPEPKTLNQALGRMLERKGLDEAVAYYDKLRERYYGSDSYDFSEGSLISMGDNLTRKGKTAEAIRFLELNLKFYPKSMDSYAVLGDAQLAAGDKEKARTAWQKALELEPENSEIKEKLAGLK